MRRTISMRQYAYSPKKREEWIREKRRERLLRIAEGVSSAHQLRPSLGKTSVRGPIVARKNRR